MTLEEFIEAAEGLGARASSLIASATSAAEMEAARNQLLGRKSGELGVLMKSLPSLSPDDRRAAGAAVNKVKGEIEEALAAKTAASPSREESHADLTMPARRRWKGGRHPVTVVIEEIQDIFREIGFAVALGPEAENEWYNFTALNFPPDHPALDMHDTLYLSDDVLLRTHPSPGKIRTLQSNKPPDR